LYWASESKGCTYEPHKRLKWMFGRWQRPLGDRTATCLPQVGGLGEVVGEVIH
jgi:hypothetical protein